MYFVSMHSTGRILGHFSSMFGSKQLFNELEIQVVVSEHNKDSVEFDLREVSVDYLKGFEKNNVIPVKTKRSKLAFAVDNDKKGVVEQITFDALKTALVPTIMFKEYGSSQDDNAVYFEAVRNDTLSFLNRLSNHGHDTYFHKLMVPPHPPDNLNEVDSLVQFYLLPKRMDFIINRHLNEAFSGRLYEQKPGNYSPKILSEERVGNWSAKIDYIHALVDDDKRVHPLSEISICDTIASNNHNNLIVLELNRILSDKLYFGQGLKLTKGFYPMYGEGLIYLDNPAFVQSCETCNDIFNDNRYVKKKSAYYHDIDEILNSLFGPKEKLLG